MNKNTLYVLIFVAIFGGLLFWNRQRKVGSEVSSMPMVNASVMMEEETYDFGTIPMYGGDVEHEYTLKNSGDEPITLGELYTSCMCTEAQVILPDGSKSKIGGMRGHGAPTFVNREIAPGESFKVRAIFDPAAHGPQGVGAVNRTVYLQTNSRQNPSVELQFSGTVVR